MGAYVAVGPHPDRELARQLIKPVGAVYARFSRAAGQLVGPLADKDQSVIRNVIDNYDMNRHGRGGASHLAYLTEDFLDVVVDLAEIVPVVQNVRERAVGQMQAANRLAVVSIRTRVRTSRRFNSLWSARIDPSSR